MFACKVLMQAYAPSAPIKILTSIVNAHFRWISDGFQMDFRWSTTNRKKPGDQARHQRDGREPVRERERGADPGGHEGEGE